MSNEELIKYFEDATIDYSHSVENALKAEDLRKSVIQALRDKTELEAEIKRLKDGWIPVDSGNLPENNKVVSVTARSLSTGAYVLISGSLSNGCWFTESGIGMLSYPNGERYEVLAWRPRFDLYIPHEE